MSKREAELVARAQDETARTTEIMRRDHEKSVEQLQRDKEEAIANVYEMAGKIKATNFQTAQSNFFRLLMLKQVKDSKEYRDRFDMSWEKFCEHVGVNRRWVDEQLADLKPFKVEFLEAFLRFSGTPINKIKYLCESIAEGNSGITENAIIYDGEIIPIDTEHQDDIKALFETLEENHKKAAAEAAETIKTKERLLRDKDKVMDKQARDIARLEKRAEITDLTEEEQEAVNLLMQVQTDFLTAISDIKKKIEPHKAPQIALRQYYYLLIFMQKVTADERILLQEAYAEAEMVPWEIDETELPPTDVMIDNTPLTAGKGMGKKVVEKIEERAAKKGKK